MAQTVEAVLALSRFVEGVRWFEPNDSRGRRVDRLPDGRTCLVFRVLAGERADVTVMGPRTHAHLKVVKGYAKAVMLQFKPGWSTPLLGVAANELTDEFVRLEDLWGPSGRELASELVRAGSVPTLLERFACAFAARGTSEPTSASLARRAARMLEAEEVAIETVSARLGVTARHLRRAFAENIGIGPRDFARSVRLQRAVRSAATSKGWAWIAAEAGYFDQAHLIAEFRKLVGMTPGAFAKRVELMERPVAHAAAE